MKYLILLFTILTLPLHGQSIIGRAMVYRVDSDPNLIPGLSIQDSYYESFLAQDTVTGIWYDYLENAVGNKWQPTQTSERTNATPFGSITATDVQGQLEQVFASIVPDQVVSITGAGSVAVTGTYPNFTATGSGVTGSGTANAIPKFTSSTAVGNSNITDDGTVVTLPKWRQAGADAAFPQIGVSAGASIGAGAALIDTGVPWNTTAIGRWEIEIGFSGSSSNGNEQIAGTVRFSVFTYSGTGAYFHVNAFGQSPKSDIGRLVKTPAGTLGVIWGEVTDGAASNSTPVYVTEVRSNFNNAAALANFSVSAITSLTGYTSIVTCGSINKSVVVPLKLNSSQSSGIANNVVQIGNSNGSVDTEVGIFMSPSGSVANILSTDETNSGALTIAARRNGFTAPNLLFKWGGTIRAGFTANGFLSVGKTPIGATYPVEIGGNAALWFNPHNTTLVGTKGLFSFSVANNVLLGHNGTSFGRHYMSSDVTPTNGQIPIFNSATGMNVYTTPTYGKDTLVIAIYCQGWNDAIATGTDYRGWRVPETLNNARIIGIQYSADDINGGTVLVETFNGVTNYGTATIPTAGFVSSSVISQTILTGQLIQPEVKSFTGSPNGLMMNLIIEKN